MTFTQNNGCTFCGSDAHMTGACPWKGKILTFDLRGFIDALENVRSFHEMSAELIAQSVFEKASADHFEQDLDMAGALLSEQPQASVCETMGRPKAECGCPDCGSSLIDWPQACAAQSAPVVPEVLHRFADLIEGLDGLELPGALPARIEKAKAALLTLERAKGTARQEQGDEVRRLREALQEVRYRVEQDRIWNGMGWTFTGIGPHKQPRIIELIDAALAASAEGKNHG